MEKDTEKAEDVEHILASREKTHGSFKQQASVSQKLKRIVQGEGSEGDMPEPQWEALEMICLKMSRIVCGDWREPDHWKDIEGYARLGEKALRD